MKVVHVLKKIENIDDDIRELRKLEKSLARNKSFSTPIYMSIEKQINILLGDKIKLMELRIDNPPKEFVDSDDDQAQAPSAKAPSDDAKKKPTTSVRAKAGKEREKKASEAKKKTEAVDETIPMMTQDLIDQKFKSIEGSLQKGKEPGNAEGDDVAEKGGDDHIKLLDIALEKGTISKNDIENEKKKVRFFKDNFPGGEY